MEPLVPPLPFGLEDEGGSCVDFAVSFEEGFGAGRFRHLLMQEQSREEEDEEMQQRVCRLRGDLMGERGGRRLVELFGKDQSL
ncbi:hypothetical protein PS1_038061 [Malus domestica]